MTVRYPTSATDPSGADVETDNASLDNVPAVRLPQASDPCQADVLNAPAKQLLDRLALVENNVLWNANGSQSRTQSSEITVFGQSIPVEFSIQPGEQLNKYSNTAQSSYTYDYFGTQGIGRWTTDTDYSAISDVIAHGTAVWRIGITGAAYFPSITSKNDIDVSSGNINILTGVLHVKEISPFSTTGNLVLKSGQSSVNSYIELSNKTVIDKDLVVSDKITVTDGDLEIQDGDLGVSGDAAVSGSLGAASLTVSQRAAVSGELRASNITTLSLSKINIAVNNAVYELCEGNGSRIAYGDESLIASKLLERAIQFGTTLIFTGGIVADSVTAQSDMFPQTLIIDPTSVSSKVEEALGYLLDGTRMAALMIKDTTV